MSVVCSICGSSNRPKAKYCAGCAHPLGGVIPSRPLEMDAVMAFRPASEAPVREDGSLRAGSRSGVPILPADTAAFWLRAGCLALAVLFGFGAWTVYVTSRGNALPLKDELLSLWAPSGDKPKAVDAAAAAAPPGSAQAASAAATSEPLPVTPPAAPQSAPQASARAEAGPPVHSSAAVASTGNALMPSPIDDGLTAPPALGEARRARRDRAAGASASARARERGTPLAADQDEGPVTSAPLPSTVAAPSATSNGLPPSYRSFDDGGPPVVAGPGPQYDYSQVPARSRSASTAAAAPSAAATIPQPAAQDLGPPIAPGPGPRYDFSHMPVVRAPAAWANGDPGAPIAAGAGTAGNGSGTR